MPRVVLSSPILSTDWLRRIGLFGTYLFASFSLLGITPATVGLVLLALTFLIGFRDWRILGRDPVAVSALLFALYVAIYSTAQYLTSPVDGLAEAAAGAGADWVKLLLFIPFAYWADGNPERIRFLLLAALIGFVVGTLRRIEWAHFDLSFFTKRFDGRLTVIAFGMFSGLGALGLIALREHFWYAKSQGAQRWLRIAAWLVLLGLMLEGLLLSQSRGSWIAFIIAAALLTKLEWRQRRDAQSKRPARRGTRIATTAAVAIAVSALFFVQHDQIEKRVQAESETFSKVLSGDLATVPSTSVGLRIHALRFAADLWLQRPWIGWGAGSSRYLLAHSERPELIMPGGARLPHLHNTYAEILVQFGVIGFGLLAALVWLLAHTTVATCGSGRIPPSLCRFFAVSLVFVLVWSLSNYRFVHHDYYFFWILFAGAAYSFRLRGLVERPIGKFDVGGSHA